MAVGQKQWYHVGVGAPPILVHFSGWIGMLTGESIWILAHGPLSKVHGFNGVTGRMRIKLVARPKPAQADDGTTVGRWLGETSAPRQP